MKTWGGRNSLLWSQLNCRYNEPSFSSEWQARVPETPTRPPPKKGAVMVSSYIIRCWLDSLFVDQVGFCNTTFLPSHWDGAVGCFRVKQHFPRCFGWSLNMAGLHFCFLFFLERLLCSSGLRHKIFVLFFSREIIYTIVYWYFCLDYFYSSWGVFDVTTRGYCHASWWNQNFYDLLKVQYKLLPNHVRGWLKWKP